MKQDKTKIYAKALAEVLFEKKTDEKKVAANFLALLQKNGNTKKAEKILELAGELLLKKQGKQKVIVETARALTRSNKEMLGEFIKETGELKEKINPELIAGLKIIINNEKQFDASLQKKVKNIF